MPKLTGIRTPLLTSRRRTLRMIIGSWLLVPGGWIARAFAERPVAAFNAETEVQTLAMLAPDKPLIPSDNIRIGAADLAENGAVVPIKIETDIKDVVSISIVAVENPVPLVAKFVLGKTTEAFVATRVKLAASGEVIAIVETPDAAFEARKAIEVTIGGCGV